LRDEGDVAASRNRLLSQFYNATHSPKFPLRLAE
jgi:hypothetical protein